MTPSRLRARARGVPLARRMLVEFRHSRLGAEDTFLVSYPKSGNTWLRFMLAQILTGSEVDFDTVESAIPMIDQYRRDPDTKALLVKSHEPYRRTYGARYQKVVYVARDPRQVALSYYTFQVRRGEFAGSLSDFVERFVAGRDIDGYGSWGDHVEGWMNSATDATARVHLTRYEDMISNPGTSLRAVLDFLGVRYSDGMVEDAITANDRNRMAAKETTSKWMVRRPRADIPFVGSGAPRGTLSEDDEELIVEAFGSTMRRLEYL